MRLQKAFKARACIHPGCRSLRKPGPAALYCHEHGNQAAQKRRSVDGNVGAETPRRPEAEIRADLAAQLTVAVRRFNSMVARDAASDPLR